MPSHRYEPLPLEDEDFSPTTAPPSFHTIALSPSPSPSQPHSQPQSQILPHLNDETATTFIPHNQRPTHSPLPVPLLSNAPEDGLSIWAPSEPEEEEDGDLIARDEILLQLTNRIEAIELHFANTPMIKTQELDLEASLSLQKAEVEKKKKKWSDFWTTVAVTIFLFWFGAVLGAAIVLPALRRRQGRG